MADNGLYMGQLLINDTLKEDAKEAIASLKAQGLVTAMLTGDAQKEAQAVAKEAGIDEVRAQLLPQDKLSELNMLRNKYGPVMFVGDGINDAPCISRCGCRRCYGQRCEMQRLRLPTLSS